MAPSPYAHVFRLIVLLVVLGVVLAFLRDLAVPRSWDHAKGYRLATLPELARLETHYEGEPSCVEGACHLSEYPPGHARQREVLAGGGHSNLACEGCHGPISNHVTGGRALKRPPPAEPTNLCLGCHRPLLGRQAVPLFDPDNPLHEAEEPGRHPSCPDCHDPHDPKVEL